MARLSQTARLSRGVLLSLLLLCTAQPAWAFYAWQDDSQQIELRGLLSSSAVGLRNPQSPQLFEKRNVNGAAVSLRLMLDASWIQHFTFEAHAVESYVPTSLQRGGSRFVQVRDVERSALLDFSHDNRRSHLIFDRLNVQYSSQNISLKLGRQPLSLAATYFFTPNDFFAPFSAQSFFRDYKPGVDAARIDIRAGELSQLSLISVLGYRAVAVSDNGWSNGISSARNSYLLRYSNVFGDFEWAVIAAEVRNDRIIGGDFQGELFEWLGLRGEGHVNFPDAVGASRRIEVAIGLEHRFANSLHLRLEQFYHGGGANTVAGYSSRLGSGGYYLARHYSAFGAGYEFTPLLQGDVALLYNWRDQSMLLSSYLRYSLSDETEAALSFSAGSGRRPAGNVIRSEYGLYGTSLSLEWRFYF